MWHPVFSRTRRWQQNRYLGYLIPYATAYPSWVTDLAASGQTCTVLPLQVMPIMAILI
jgi:hypothetical protein